MQHTLIAQPSPPPWVDRVRSNYFSSFWSSAVSLICLIVIMVVFWELLNWALLQAVWSIDENTDACQAASGACWAVIAERGRLILFGLYPYEEHWRSALSCMIVVLVTILSCMPRFWRTRWIATIWASAFISYFVLMRGGLLGLSPVAEQYWGGLALTLFIFISIIVIGMPMAICMALMRRSELPVISLITGFFIDTVRSLPLLSILFAFVVIAPLAVPEWLNGDKLYRVILGFALFFAAYQAEIFRGGLQIISAGQDDAAKAIGLGYWQRTFLIMLPQAFKNTLPPTISQVVITFKETSLAIIVGFFDVLASGNAAYGTGKWTFAYIEVYVFIGGIYFLFAFSLSRYGAFLERRLAHDNL